MLFSLLMIEITRRLLESITQNMILIYFPKKLISNNVVERADNEVVRINENVGRFILKIL